METYHDSKFLTKEEWEKWNDYAKTGKINGKKENNIFAVARHIGVSVSDINAYGIEQRAKKYKMADGGGIEVGDVVEVKEPNYGRDRDYYVVADKVGYDKDGFLISDVHKREGDVFEEEQLKKLYADGGGMEEEIDLFEDYDNIPAKVQKVLDKYEDAFMDGDYEGLKEAKKELNKIGYTFDFDMDGTAYGLRPIGKMYNGGSIKNNNDYMKATDKYDYYGALLDDAREENNTTEITKLRELMRKLETEINRYERNYKDGGSVGEIEAKIADFRKRAENKSIPESAKNKFLSMAEELEKTLPKAEKKEEAKAEKPKFKVGDVVVLQGGDGLPKKITSIKENKKGEIIYSGYYESKPSEKFSMDGTELVIFKKPKYEPKEKEEKGESKKAELSEKECEDLLAKYKAEREARKERVEKREKQGKPAELTPAETTKKAVDRVTNKIDAKAEKGKSVKGDIKAVFSQFKSAVAELKKYKDEIDEKEVRSLIKELESLLTK